MFREMLIDTERLKFRRLELNDAEKLLNIYADHAAMKHRGSAPLNHIKDAIEMIQKQDKGKSSRFGIIEKSKNLLIGTLLLKQDGECRDQCEIGFSFHKPEWNKGYGYETLEMLENNFQKLKHFKELKAWCKNENTASIRLFEKAGFSLRLQTDYPESSLFIMDKELNNNL